jgi:hypothetical protein
MSAQPHAMKKTVNTQKPKSRNHVKASAVTQRPTYAELRQQLADSLEREKSAFKDLQDRDQQLAESLRRESATARENEQLRRERDETLEHQTATSEVLVAAHYRSSLRIYFCLVSADFDFVAVAVSFFAS